MAVEFINPLSLSIMILYEGALLLSWTHQRKDGAILIRLALRLSSGLTHYNSGTTQPALLATTSTMPSYKPTSPRIYNIETANLQANQPRHQADASSEVSYPPGHNRCRYCQHPPRRRKRSSLSRWFRGRWTMESHYDSTLNQPERASLRGVMEQ